MRTSAPSRRVLICDDTPKQYATIRDYLTGEGFECVPQVSTLEAARTALLESHRHRQWLSLVFIDLELRRSGEKWNGAQVYQALRSEFPDETYIIYTSHDADRFRTEINRLAFLDVEIVLLDEIVTRRSLSLALARVITGASPDHIFMVSGRHTVKNAKLQKLLQSGLGLTVVNFDIARERVQKTPDYIFEVVLAGIQMSHATVVLFTDDEVATLRREFRAKGERGASRRARPNVYIEAGYAMGLRPKRTVFVEWPDKFEGFEGPSDFQGIHVLKYRDNAQGRLQLQRRLEAARCVLKPSMNFQRMRV